MIVIMRGIKDTKFIDNGGVLLSPEDQLSEDELSETYEPNGEKITFDDFIKMTPKEHEAFFNPRFEKILKNEWEAGRKTIHGDNAVTD